MSASSVERIMKGGEVFSFDLCVSTHLYTSATFFSNSLLATFYIYILAPCINLFYIECYWCNKTFLSRVVYIDVVCRRRGASGWSCQDHLARGYLLTQARLVFFSPSTLLYRGQAVTSIRSIFSLVSKEKYTSSFLSLSLCVGGGGLTTGFFSLHPYILLYFLLLFELWKICCVGPRFFFFLTSLSCSLLFVCVCLLLYNT